jgi:hypothetical protein
VLPVPCSSVKPKVLAREVPHRDELSGVVLLLVSIQNVIEIRQIAPLLKRTLDICGGASNALFRRTNKKHTLLVITNKFLAEAGGCVQTTRSWNWEMAA